MFSIVGGQFLNGDGSPIANGTVVMTLSVAATVISTGLAATSSYTFNLDANGVIIGPANVNGNAELTPGGTSYTTVAKNSGGTTVWGPLTWIVGPSAAYAGTLFPGVMALPLITGVVMGASGTTHAQGATPDTPAGAGTTKFLREDATWQVPSLSAAVTSVAATVPAFLTIAGTPITTSGTLSFDLRVESPNVVFAGPLSSPAVAPYFRSLQPADLPNSPDIFGKAGINHRPGQVPDTSPVAGSLRYLREDVSWGKPAGANSDYIDVTLDPYNVVADGRTTTDCSLIINNPQITSATMAFTSADVGKTIWCHIAYAGNATPMAVYLVPSTILSVQSATVATASVNATNTGGSRACFLGTENGAGLRKAGVDGNNTGRTIQLPSGSIMYDGAIPFNSSGVLPLVVRGRGMRATNIWPAPTITFTGFSAVFNETSNLAGEFGDLNIDFHGATLTNATNQSKAVTTSTSDIYNLVISNFVLTNGVLAAGLFLAGSANVRNYLAYQVKSSDGTNTGLKIQSSLTLVYHYGTVSTDCPIQLVNANRVSFIGATHDECSGAASPCIQLKNSKNITFVGYHLAGNATVGEMLIDEASDATLIGCSLALNAGETPVIIAVGGRLTLVGTQLDSSPSCSSQNAGTLVDGGGNIILGKISGSGTIISDDMLQGTCIGTASSSATLGLYNLGQTTTRNCTSTTVDQGAVMRRDGILSNLSAKAGSGGRISGSGVVTVLKNNVATILTCTLGTSLSCVDSTNIVPFVKGDVISIQFSTQSAESLANVSAQVWARR